MLFAQNEELQYMVLKNTTNDPLCNKIFIKNVETKLWRFIVYVTLTILYKIIKFLSEERTIPIEVQERILLFHHAGCNVLTIRVILKEEFSDIVTWIYNDLYNFIYQKEGIRWEFNSNNFVKELEYLKFQDNEFYYEVLIDSETNEFR